MEWNFFVEESKDNYKILKINKKDRSFYLGSKYNEKREIDKIVESAKPFRDKDNYIILGLGMGNHVIELINRKEDSANILVIECEERWLELSKSQKNIEALRKEKGITVTNNEEEILEFCGKNINESNVDCVKILAYSNYNLYYKNELVKLYGVIKNHIEKVFIDRNTKELFSNVWFKSRMKNLKYMIESDTVSMYEGINEGKSAIIVSAGPSLSKNINCLKNMNNSLVISGGRTLKSLKTIDVNPDYTVIVDPSEESYQLVEGYIDKVDTKMVYHMGTPYKALEEHKGIKILYSDEEVISEIFGRDTGTLSVGGSVAHSMTEFAAIMGCNPIIFIGQDLAYTDEKGHAEIADSPWESVKIENYVQSSDILVDDINGGKVRTSIILNLYRKQLEQIIEKHSNIKFINATEGGAAIKGTDIMSLKEALKQYDNEEKKDDNEEKKDDNEEKKDDNRKVQAIDYKIKDRLINKLKASEEAMIQSIKLYKEATEILQKYHDTIITGTNSVNNFENKLKKIDGKILKLNKRIIFMHEITYPVICGLNKLNEYSINSEDSQKEKLLKSINKNKKLYEGISEVLFTSLPVVKDVINYLCTEEKENEGK